MNNEMFTHIHHVLRSCICALQWYEEQRRGIDRDNSVWLNAIHCISIYGKELQDITNEWREKNPLIVIQEEE